YLDVPFDLSQVIFIATANYIEGIPAPLLDRMELISLAGYTEREKIEIARRYIVPRQLEENGLKPNQGIVEEPSLATIVSDQRLEAAGRELERQIGAICRAMAARAASGKLENFKITSDVVHEILGPV